MREDTDRMRVRIADGAQMVEVEGGPEVLERFDGLLQAMSDRIKEKDGGSQAQGVENESSASNAGLSFQAPFDEAQVPEYFGQMFHQIPDDANQTDRILAAGYYVQCQDEDDAFSTRQAHDLLKEQGVKLGNASQTVRQNIDAGRAFSVEEGKYRVSKKGLNHLEELFSEAGE